MSRDEYRNEQRRERKRILVELKGGKCVICGYNKCIGNIEFHHINPCKKEFTISRGYRTLEEDIKETEKCILLCANCHGEKHNKLFY